MSSQFATRAFDSEKFSGELSALESLFRTKTQEHSDRLKEAEKAGWAKGAINRANEVLRELDEIHRQISDLGRSAEEHLASEGISLPDEPGYPMDQPARYWKNELQQQVVPITAYIEDSLERGLDCLISRLPLPWWKEQLALREVAGSAHLRDSLELYGGVSGMRLPVPIHRYAYGLMLARESLEKREDFDIYSGSLLVPSIAALCALLPPLHEVSGGLTKLDELCLAPSDEVDSRLYEILVAARAALLGRSIEFLKAGAELTPDLRVHDLPFPAVVEIKRQSRLSAHESAEFRIMQDVFRRLTNAHARRSLIGTLTVVAQHTMEDVGVKTIAEAALRCTSGLNPYSSLTEAWGTLSFSPLSPVVELTQSTRIYSPDFLQGVFGWNAETTEYDGICAIIANNRAMLVNRADLPFCIRWRSDAEEAVSRKARSLASQLSEAMRQIPVGETGFIYLAYEETHRASIADSRTKKVLEQTASWEIRKRAINPQLIVVDRLYPGALHEGRPNLVESAMPTGFTEDNVWAGVMPLAVFIDPASQEGLAAI